MKKKKAFTLLEIMIVIFLIGLIGSIVGYNMKGSLDEGRAFKTQQAILRLTDILELEIARGADIDQVQNHADDVLQKSALIKYGPNTLKDGWGNPLNIEVKHGEVTITSQKYEDYRTAQSQQVRKKTP